MRSNMMDRPLLVSSIIEHARTTHPNTEIVSRRCEGDIHRYTLAESAARAKKLANALSQNGVLKSDRIATLAWNNYRHYELYFGVAGMGAVLHTINPRLFPEQLVYIINHAKDKWLFVDLTFIPLLEAIQDQISGIEKFIILADEANMPETSLPNVVCYEELIKHESEVYDWPVFDENQSAYLCYTSGTTGNPKGVSYSHRSTVLHSMASISADALGIDGRSCILPVVPMFHVNAWGTPFSCAMVGAKMVFPGPGMDGASLWELIESEQPDLLLGVPTVWLMLLNHMSSIGKTLDSVKNVVVGGSAAPLSMIKRFQEEHDAFLIHAWGMTEMSPIGTVNSLTKEMAEMPLEQRYQLQLKQGRPVYGVEMKIVNDEGGLLPHDGVAFGNLLVRGPWITGGYYLNDDTSNFIDGWFDTGDVATIDENNYLSLVDRAKDVIKSGGEWISSIDLENAAIGHPELVECCVIGAPHPKWDERPILLAIKQQGSNTDADSVKQFLSDKIAKWWMPDDVIFVDELPHTATGKLLKVNLRKQYQNHFMDAT
ncbi:MAG: long-chain-fatty-acid--CoA ligase [Oleiphilus sp.]